MIYNTPSRPAQPYADFLDAIDEKIDTPVELHCMGGLVVSQHYGMPRQTHDLDTLLIQPENASALLEAIAGQGSDFHLKYKLYIQFVAVAAYRRITKNDYSRCFPSAGNICASRPVIRTI